MSPVHATHLVILILAIAFASLAYALTKRGLEELLSRTVAIPGGVAFYMRSFLLLLLFGAVGQVVAVNPNVKPGQHFMEYVWAVAGALGDSFGYIFLTLGIYLVVMTILVATLKPNNDQ